MFVCVSVLIHMCPAAFTGSLRPSNRQGGKPPQSPGRSPNAQTPGGTGRPGATLDATNRYGLLGLLNVIRYCRGLAVIPANVRRCN